MHSMPVRSPKLTKLTVAAVSLLLAGCRAQEPAPGANQTLDAGAPATITYAGEGRDRLCLSREPGGVAGFITYAANGVTNCAVRGTWTDGDGAAIRPNGDERCVIRIDSESAVTTLRDGGPACAYYCGPNASFAGRVFTDKVDAGRATDLAGDPLC